MFLDENAPTATGFPHGIFCMTLHADTPHPPTVLVIDDDAACLRMLQNVLAGSFGFLGAANGELGLAMAMAAHPPDLILLDTEMPGLGGHEVCRRLKADPGTRHIPVILLSEHADADEGQLAWALGAVDCITKPLSAPLLLSRLRAQHALKLSGDFAWDNNASLESEVVRRTAEAAAIQDVTIMAMASMAETRDADGNKHILRTQRYVRALAWQLCGHPRFSAFLSVSHIQLLFKSAPLHDIGKVGIPDRILLKPGKLSSEEFEVMKTHTVLGRDAIANAEAAMGVQLDFLQIAKEIAYAHHEKWDGTGYPDQLKGDAIPISARLMAVADVYDALISRRVYKEPVAHDKAAEIIVQSSGRFFDPDVVAAFLALQETFKAIALSFPDTDDDLARKAHYLKLATPHAV